MESVSELGQDIHLFPIPYLVLIISLPITNNIGPTQANTVSHQIRLLPTKPPIVAISKYQFQQDFTQDSKISRIATMGKEGLYQTVMDLTGACC